MDDPRICSKSCIDDACSGSTHGLKITNNNKKRDGDGQPLCTGRTFVDSIEGTKLTLTQKKLGVSCFTGSRTRKLSMGIINRVSQSHFNAFCTSLSNKNEHILDFRSGCDSVMSIFWTSVVGVILLLAYSGLP